MRKVWLVAGAVTTVVALTLSTLNLWRVFAGARTPRDVTLRSIPFDGDSVRVKAGKGQVALSVLPGKAGELLVERALRWDGERPKVTEDWDPRSRTLSLEAVCPGSDQPKGPLCQADYTLFVPPETDLEASTRSGHITVHGLFGDVRLTSVSGDVDVREVSGDLWARSGTGSVDADGLTGKKADVEVGSGDVELMFAVTPSQVKAVVRASGDVSVHVPPQARAGTDGAHAYDVTVSGTNTTVDVPQREDAKRTIVATTAEGIVTVCCQ